MTTNLERIRQMTADELAQWLFLQCNYCCDICIVNSIEDSIEDCHISCKDGIRQWLEQKSEE